MSIQRSVSIILRHLFENNDNTTYKVETNLLTVIVTENVLKRSECGENIYINI